MNSYAQSHHHKFVGGTTWIARYSKPIVYLQIDQDVLFCFNNEILLISLKTAVNPCMVVCEKIARFALLDFLCNMVKYKYTNKAYRGRMPFLKR